MVPEGRAASSPDDDIISRQLEPRRPDVPRKHGRSPSLPQAEVGLVSRSLPWMLGATGWPVPSLIGLSAESPTDLLIVVDCSSSSPSSSSSFSCSRSFLLFFLIQRF